MPSKYAGYKARPDDYFDDYFGSEYAGMDGMETITRAHEIVLTPDFYGKEALGEMAKLDPRMVDLVLGLLFRYEP